MKTQSTAGADDVADAAVSARRSAARTGQATGTRRLSPLDQPLRIRDYDGQLLAAIKLESVDVAGGQLTLRGWTLGFEKLELGCNGAVLKGEVLRHDRTDVMKLLPGNAFLPGYSITTTYQPGAVYTLRWHVGDGRKTSTLEFAVDMGLSPAEPAADAGQSLCQIDSVNDFTVSGWCLVDGRAASDLTLQVGDTSYAVKPVRIDRPDVASRYGAEPRCGFEILIPGHVWSASAAGQTADSVSIEIRADAGKVTSRFQLTQSQVVEWTGQQVRTESRSQPHLFTALEHLHFGGFYSHLDAGTLGELRAFASRFGLADYISATAGAVAPVNSDWTSVWLWDALRDLNARIDVDTDADGFWAAFIAVRSGIGIQAVIERFDDAVLPSLCRHDLVDRFAGLVPVAFARWRSLSEGEDLWSLGLSLVAAAAGGDVVAIRDLLARMAQRIDHGWLVTEALEWSMGRLIVSYLQGDIAIQAFQKILYALLSLLDSLRGNWHSRLADMALMRSGILFFRAFDRYPDYLQRDLIRGLLRHYGLMPQFWVACAAHPVLSEHALWLKADRSWSSVTGAFEFMDDESRIADFLASLRFFDSLGNPDARRFARERIGPVMNALNDDLNGSLHGLLSFLLEEPEEGVRYAAFPVVTDFSLERRYVECGPLLYSTLRELSGSTDFRHSMHQRWGRQVCEIATGAAMDAESRKSSARTLLDTLLVKARSGDVLACDLASWLAVHPVTGLMDAVDDIWPIVVDLAVSDGSKKALAAPLAASLSRLRCHIPERYLKRLISLPVAGVAEVLSADVDSPSATTLAPNRESWPGDTLVVIYSCRKYLGDRIRAIRDTWVQALKVRGVPYVVLVGDGDDSLKGDILALNVSDAYEALPQKTLKLVEWVHANTRFQYVYKIDDDCYLDSDRFFENLSYRSHHYYGRILSRTEGSMDRLWHQNKSSSEFARQSIDKSPEPSVYADGGGGYVLSRYAMKSLCEVARSQAGQRIVSVSLMEDKLVGDLLALVGISPGDEGYESYQRRRTFGAAVPVGMWENLFFPSKNTPTVMCHLDGHLDQARVHASRSSGGLSPFKVWPTCERVRLKTDKTAVAVVGANQLELLSSVETLQAVTALSMLLVAVVRNELTLLPHFLAHYRKLGVRGFLIADNCSDDGTREYLLKQPDVAVFSADTEYRLSEYGVAWQQALLGNFCVGKWAVIADADEFLVYPQSETRLLDEYVGGLSVAGADAVRIAMIDMYPHDSLSDADFSRSDPFIAAPWFDRDAVTPWNFSRGFFSIDRAYVSALRQRLIPDSEPHAFNSSKIALVRYKPWMRFAKGLHDAAGVKLYDHWASFAHFKYHSGFEEKVKLEVRRGQHFNGAAEYQRYQALLLEGSGYFGVENISTQFKSSESFRFCLKKA